MPASTDLSMRAIPRIRRVTLATHRHILPGQRIFSLVSGLAVVCVLLYLFQREASSRPVDLNSWWSLPAVSWLWTNQGPTYLKAEYGRPLPKHVISHWSMPYDFLLNCDEISRGAIPPSHPLPINDLFGSNASKSVDPVRTSELLHQAAAVQQELDDKAVREPSSQPCIQTFNSRLGIRHPKVALVTTMSVGHPFNDKYGAKSLQNKREYAARHGYDFHIIDNDLAKPRHVYLGSVIAVLSTLRFYDWVFKVDLDTLIMTPDVSLESFVDDRFDLIGALDCFRETGINGGVYFIRNSTWSHMFLLQVFIQSANGVEHFDWLGDQAIMRYLIFPYFNYRIRNHVKVVSPRDFNIYQHTGWTCPGGFGWEKGDFLVHVTGARKEGELSNKDAYFDEYWSVLGNST